MKAPSKRFKTVHPFYDNEGPMEYEWKVYPGGHTVVRFEGCVVADCNTLADAISDVTRDCVESAKACLVDERWKPIAEQLLVAHAGYIPVAGHRAMKPSGVGDALAKEVDRIMGAPVRRAWGDTLPEFVGNILRAMNDGELPPIMEKETGA